MKKNQCKKTLKNRMVIDLTDLNHDYLLNHLSLTLLKQCIRKLKIITFLLNARK